MKYSDYTLDQIVEHYNKYQEICNIFLELANDSDTKEKLESILYSGGYKDYGLCSKLINRDNPAIEGKRRIDMAYLLLKNPETFNQLVENKVNLFHGTNGNALFGILKYGLNSHKESEEKKIDVYTGEHWSRINGARDYISLTDVLDIAQYYSCKKPKEGDESLSFEVIVGTSVDDVLQQKVCRVSSELSEIGVESNLPLDNIKTICVPSDKVEFVKKIINSSEVKILSMDDIRNKFYYIDQEFGDIRISYEIVREFRDNLSKIKDTTKRFELDEIKNMSNGRFFTSIKRQIDKFLFIINKEKKVKDDGHKIR